MFKPSLSLSQVLILLLWTPSTLLLSLCFSSRFYDPFWPLESLGGSFFIAITSFLQFFHISLISLSFTVLVLCFFLIEMTNLRYGPANFIDVSSCNDRSEASSCIWALQPEVLGVAPLTTTREWIFWRGSWSLMRNACYCTCNNNFPWLFCKFLFWWMLLSSFTWYSICYLNDFISSHIFKRFYFII